MQKTLYLKFLIGYLIFGFFGFVAVATFTTGMIKEQVIREESKALYEEATLVANTYATDLYNSETTLETVKYQLDALDTYLSANLWIINPSGRMVLNSNEEIDVGKEVFVEGFDPTITAGSYYTKGRFFDYFEEDMLSVFAPITSEYKVKAYVVIHYPMSDIRETVNDYAVIAYIQLSVTLLLSLIIILFFTQFVYKPIHKITIATEAYAAGNMHYPLQVDSSDEIGYLAASLSYMASQVAQSEDNQKKLVANISHDFRSPLTSIRGYLEAMQDGTIPPEMYDKYLQIVINETDRLTKLTNSLLTLNNLNTKGMILEKIDFDINQIIRNTVASFEGTCRAKKIGVEIVLTGEKMLVTADQGKIQQVIYNLLDNAIKFSHNNSVIIVETTEKKNKIFVSIKDHGIGIPKEEVKMIWDRFYKSDLSRGKDKKGTGLGLSIVKEIINSHDENINVISTEGVGTEFIFSLQKSDKNEED